MGAVELSYIKVEGAKFFRYDFKKVSLLFGWKMCEMFAE